MMESNRTLYIKGRDGFNAELRLLRAVSEEELTLLTRTTNLGLINVLGGFSVMEYQSREVTDSQINELIEKTTNQFILNNYEVIKDLVAAITVRAEVFANGGRTELGYDMTLTTIRDGV
jgi:hypothetical protein